MRPMRRLGGVGSSSESEGLAAGGMLNAFLPWLLVFRPGVGCFTVSSSVSSYRWSSSISLSLLSVSSSSSTVGESMSCSTSSAIASLVDK
jgi:hypothetical protein